MKLEGLHKGKSRAINLGAEARKESSGETFRGGSASPEDDGNRRRRSNLFHGRSHTNSVTSRIFATALRTLLSLRNAYRPSGNVTRALSARSLRATFASYREKN